MKLLTVGSSAQSNIFLGSQYVSSYHADIIILDNGDILICDRNSSNGTFCNGARMTPNTEVMVRRGDNILFADAPLDWSLIPDARIEPDTKRLIGIGSNQRNQIRVNGQRVSRFHATIKQTNEGKWFICDHSTNGTTVNNERIPKDIYVKLRKNDEIRCAGTPVRNPIPSGPGYLKYLVAAAVACLLVVGAASIFSKSGGKMHWIPWSNSKTYSTFAPSTVIIYMGYHYKVSAGSLDLKQAFGADEFVFNGTDLEKYDGNNSQQGFATGFYISKDGLIATNLHVARPWIFDGNSEPVADYVRGWLNQLSQKVNPNYANYISQVEVEGEVDFMYAIPHDQYFDGKNAMNCIETASSTDPYMDVAILKAMLPNHQLQEGSTYVDLGSIPDRSAYKTGSKIITIGFPMATNLQKISKQTLEAIYSDGTMSASNNKYDFGHTANVTNGASGSPVFNRYGQLLGIISSGFGNGYNFAVRAEYINQLLDQEHIIIKNGLTEK